MKCLWISSQAKKSVFGRPRFYTTKNFVKLSPEVPHNGKRRHAFRLKDACASVGCASVVLSLNKNVKWGGGGSGLYNWDRIIMCFKLQNSKRGQMIQVIKNILLK